MLLKTWEKLRKAANKTSTIYFGLSPVLLSYDCYNKLLQTWSLKTTEIYSVSVLEVQNSKLILLVCDQGVQIAALHLI